MLDETPLFSLVFIIRNGARFLSRALEGALAQERKDTEIMVLDLNSSDGTADILRRYQGQLGLCQTLQDSRWSDAAQAALVIARGEWVIFLDSCHWLSQGALGAMASSIQQNPQASIITGCGRVVEETAIGAIAEKRSILARDIAMSAATILEEPMLHVRAVRRTALLEAGGFNLDATPRLPRMVAQRSAMLGMMQKQMHEVLLPYSICSEVFVQGQPARQIGLASLKRLAECQQLMADRFGARFVNSADTAILHEWARQQLRVLATLSLKQRKLSHGWYFFKRSLGLEAAFPLESSSVAQAA
jgi:glycosyltransferase involved in cell wall biosynthesis